MSTWFWWEIEEKGPLGKLRRRWEGNSKMDLREVGWRGMDWIHLGPDRDQWQWQTFVNKIMNFRIQ
jgi:hypothetical protein